MQATMASLWCRAGRDNRELYGTEGVYRGARVLHGTDGLTDRMGRGADMGSGTDLDANVWSSGNWVGGGNCDRESVKFPRVMMARRDVPRDVVQCEWTSPRKWLVIADWRIKDTIEENEPPAEELGKCRCMALAEADVEVGTITTA
jgi:hypothetical protein